MPLNTLTGLYEKYFINVPAGHHEFKVTNGTWDQSWGAADGGNFVLETEKTHNSIVFFNA